MTGWEWLAMLASVIMPMWNIPLIIKILHRRSSQDLSLHWLWGVWTCMVLMVPWGLVTQDKVLKVFTLVNVLLFSVVVFVVMKYRKVSEDA
jgi:uncharacterized protein with PQ loop repeat